jgi:thiamine-monophosphate kinase
MMDISDGLSTDLARLCKSSKVAARIYADQIPAVDVPGSLKRSRKLDPLILALHGGEDYGLMFTVAKGKASRIPGIFGRKRISRIGEIVRGSGVTIITASGDSSPLTPGGWDPFGKR